jgi:hypothetical protein
MITIPLNVRPVTLRKLKTILPSISTQDLPIFQWRNNKLNFFLRTSFLAGVVYLKFV